MKKFRPREVAVKPCGRSWMRQDILEEELQPDARKEQ